MASYLGELRLLLGRKVGEGELISLEETDSLQLRSRSVQWGPKVKFQIEFEDKSSERFGRLWSWLSGQNSSDVYIWTPFTGDCGLLPPVALPAINIEFPFDLNDAGILALTAEDFRDRLVLDFFEESGVQELEVELWGKSWGHGSY